MVQEHLLDRDKAMTKPQKSTKPDTGAALSLILLFSTLACVLTLFIISL